MRLFSKVGVFVAAAAVAVAVAVAPALAAVSQQQVVALQVGEDQGTGYIGACGDEILLQPALMTDIERPGDKIHFQAYVQDVDASGTPVGMRWKDFRDFEDVQLEDTNTVPPFSFGLGIDDAVILGDGSVIFPRPPYQIRCEYKPYGNSTVTGTSTPAPTFSETETVNVIRNAATKVLISKSGSVKKSGTTLNFQVSPNCGIGTVRVTVVKTGSKKGTTYNLTTDEDGFVSAKLRLGSKAGSYTVSARFLGNVYGAASKTAAKKFAAK